MGVFLRLHGVSLAVGFASSEVGYGPVSAGAMFFAKLGGERGDARHQIAAGPEFGLGHVLCGNEKPLDGKPTKPVSEDDYAFLTVYDCRGQVAGDYLAEGAVVQHGFSERRAIWDRAPASLVCCGLAV